MLLFVNGCLREGSRTERLARLWLARRSYEGTVVELPLAEVFLDLLDATGPAPLAAYNEGVATGDFSHPLFSVARQFAQADEVLIAAPLWNYTLPAKLHAYLELACSQGVTFGLDETGAYTSLCHIDRLTFVTTAGGSALDASDDHCFGLVRTLAERFWQVPRIDCVAAWGLDLPGADVDALLAEALA